MRPSRQRRTILNLAALLLLLATTAAAQTKIRGISVDAARLPESPDYYRRLIDFAHDWGLNTIVFRLTDDQGSAMRFERHPELITHANALTKAQLRDLALYGQSKGVTLIPEIESFGHAGYITRTAAHAALADLDPATGRRANTLSPIDPGSVALITDLIEEAAEAFPGPYIHLGADEVVWGGGEHVRAAIAEYSAGAVWAAYLNFLEAAARRQGKTVLIWADHPLRKDPSILNHLEKSIILVDWDYATTDAFAVNRYARMAVDRGFRVVGGAAGAWCRWGPRIGEAQLRNIDVYTGVYAGIDHPGNLGVLTGNWVPVRYLQNAIWDWLAYTSVALTEGPGVARREALGRFVSKHYGAEWDERWREMFGHYYDSSPNRLGCAPRGAQPILPAPWDSADSLAASLNAPVRGPNGLDQLLEEVAALESSVTRNHADFAAFKTSIEYLRHLYWRTDVLASGLSGTVSPARAASAIAVIATEDQRLLADLQEEWNRGRPADSPLRDSVLPNYGPADTLLASFSAAARYSARLAANTSEFLAVLERTGRAIEQDK